ncbi:MAG: M48 family metallopeptidase [Stomatobaculum sp.]|nr:M48 family metallopeptidase [Stomatobaculum sp.]
MENMNVSRGEEVREQIRRTRHRMEVKLYAACIILGLMAACLLVFFITDDFEPVEELKEFLGMFGLSAEKPDFGALLLILLVLIGIIGGIGSIILMLVVYLFTVYSQYASQLSYSVRVSEKNFPEIYQKVKEYTELLDLPKEPEVFVQQMNGELNAFTCWVPGRIFIQLNAEIVDLAYMENKDFDTVYFIMAHEMGHAYLHHVQLQYAVWCMLINFIPVLGQYILFPLLSRSREYSADRVAQALTGGTSELEAMMLLSAGRHAYKYLSPQDYLRDITRKRNPVERFAVRMVNLLATHPIMPYRTQAILDPGKKSGKLL